MLFAPCRESGFETALPNVAPGSDDVGNNIDAQWHAHDQLQFLYASRSLAFIILPVDVRGISATNT
jgi:hypothetical protein